MKLTSVQEILESRLIKHFHINKEKIYQNKGALVIMEYKKSHRSVMTILIQKLIALANGTFVFQFYWHVYL